MKRPNILFAFADDWGRYANVYNEEKGGTPLNKFIDTPTIDKIANEGVIFTNAVVPAPTCTPCRSSVLSGRYFWQTRLGAILTGAVWDENIPTYPKILEKSGYHTGATYKTWGPGVPFGVPPYGSKEHYYNEAGSTFGSFSHQVTKNIRSGMEVDEAKQPLYEEVKNNFLNFLSNRNGDEPFCYWWGPTNTHRTWEKGSGKELWGLEPDDLKGNMPDFFPDSADIREDVADYLGECMAYDRGLEVILKELEAIGELDNTLIVVSGDHGIPGFPRAKCNLYDIGCEVALMARLPGIIPEGLVVDGMTNLMDLAPTFLEVGRCEIPECMAGHSLWKKMCDEDTKENEWVITGRERHVATAREWNLPYPQRAIRTKDFLYIYNFCPDRWPMGSPNGMDDLTAEPIAWENIVKDTYSAYPDMDASPTKAWMVHHRAEAEHTSNFLLAFDKRPQEELFDLNKDPHQMHNIAYGSEYAHVKAKLKQVLMDELYKQKDPRVCDDVVRYENSPFTDAFPQCGEEAHARAEERLSRSGI
jgi:N-sulfoglucosamine sulfohydrolase